MADISLDVVEELSQSQIDCFVLITDLASACFSSCWLKGDNLWTSVEHSLARLAFEAGFYMWLTRWPGGLWMMISKNMRKLFTIVCIITFTVSFTLSFWKWSYRRIVFKHACYPFVLTIFRNLLLVHAFSSLVFATVPVFRCIPCPSHTRMPRMPFNILQCFLWTSLWLVFIWLFWLAIETIPDPEILIPQRLCELFRHVSTCFDQGCISLNAHMVDGRTLGVARVAWAATVTMASGAMVATVATVAWAEALGSIAESQRKPRPKGWRKDSHILWGNESVKKTRYPDPEKHRGA